MLPELLEALGETGGVVTVMELSRRTGIEPDLVRQMLELLADRGRLDRFGVDCPARAAGCRACALVRFCGSSRLQAYVGPKSQARGGQTG